MSSWGHLQKDPSALTNLDTIWFVGKIHFVCGCLSTVAQSFVAHCGGAAT